MNHNQPARTSSRARTPRLTRRAALSAIAGLGLATGGAIILPPSAVALTRQDGGTPEAPPMPATPVLGEQPDGTVTWRVQAGHMDMDLMMEAMAFFPDEITINVGDRIFFDIHSFHTVTLPGEMEVPALFVPESMALGTPAAATSDGERWVANPIGAFPSGPPVHDGASYVNSGVPDPTMPPFVVEFTQPGTFDLVCLVHPATMKGTVVVQEQGAERPYDQAYYDEQAATQIAAIVEQGQALTAEYDVSGMASPAAAGAAVWDVAVGAGEDQAQVMRFLPDRLEISAGDTVRWTNHGVTEPHTVTFLGDTEPPELIMIEPQPAGPPLLVLNPDVMAPAGGPSYDGGYANSGWLQEDASEFPEGITFPTTWELTFDQPGEYPYYCTLHGAAGGEGEPALVGMVGTIVVS